MATKKSLIQQIRGNALSINQIAAELSATDEPLAYNFVQTQKEKFNLSKTALHIPLHQV